MKHPDRIILAVLVAIIVGLFIILVMGVQTAYSHVTQLAPSSA